MDGARSAARCAAMALACALGAASAEWEEKDPGAGGRDPDYAAGRAALLRKDWDEAVQRLARVALREPENADVQSFIGFAHRNQGRYEAAFLHYERALAIDPRHKGAHEYVGETYLKVGDVAGAERHLAELKRLCPLSCEPLEELQRAIGAWRVKAAKP